VSVGEGLGLEVVAPSRRILDWRVTKNEVAPVALKVGAVGKLTLGDSQKKALELVEHFAGLNVVGLEAVLDVGVEVVEDLGFRVL